MSDMKGRAGALPADVAVFRQVVAHVAAHLMPPIRGTRQVSQEPDGGALRESVFTIADTLPIYREGKPAEYERVIILQIELWGLETRPGSRIVECRANDDSVRVRAAAEGLESYLRYEFGAKCVWKFNARS